MQTYPVGVPLAGLFNCSGICGFHYDVNVVWEVGVSGEVLPAQLKNFDLVQVQGRSSGEATIRNCHFHDAYDGVMQLRSSGATVENNLFERAHGMHVATAVSWLEGAAALEKVVVKGNIFRSCCGTVGGHHHQKSCNPITFTGCPTCVAANNSFG